MHVPLACHPALIAGPVVAYCHPGAYRVAKPLMPLLFELRPVGSVMGLQAAPLHSPFKPLAPASEPGDRVQSGIKLHARKAPEVSGADFAS